MMKRFLASLVLALAALVSPVVAEDAALVDKLQDVSVTIKSGSGQGSGVLVTRKIGNDDITFVWTAGHVVDNLRKQRTVVDPATGTNRIVVEFDDAAVVKEFTDEGRRIGETKMDAKVLRYSDSEQGEDLALLLIRKKNYSKVNAEFYLDEKIPPLGTELYHVGSLLGQFGANSLTTGIISQHGRVLQGLGANGVVFDQTSVTAFPGSSGGGVFKKDDGKYIGMLVRGGGEQFNFIVPIRRLKAWAVKSKIEWAIDPSKEMPTMEEILKLSVEDVGASFNTDKAAAKPHQYKTFLKVEDEPTLADPSVLLK
jgi:hypothetical protein